MRHFVINSIVLIDGHNIPLLELLTKDLHVSFRQDRATIGIGEMKLLLTLLLFVLSGCGFTPSQMNIIRGPASMSTVFKDPYYFQDLREKLETLHSYTVVKQRTLSLAEKVSAPQESHFLHAKIEASSEEIRGLEKQIKALSHIENTKLEEVLLNFAETSPLHSFTLKNILRSDMVKSVTSALWEQEYQRLSSVAGFQIREKNIEHKAHLIATRKLSTKSSAN